MRKDDLQKRKKKKKRGGKQLGDGIWLGADANTHTHAQTDGPAGA